MARFPLSYFTHSQLTVSAILKRFFRQNLSQRENGGRYLSCLTHSLSLSLSLFALARWCAFTIDLLFLIQETTISRGQPISAQFQHLIRYEPQPLPEDRALPMDLEVDLINWLIRLGQKARLREILA